MRNNDLRYNTDENDIFGELKMYREGDKHKDRIFVLVEAKSDENFYRKFIVGKAVFFIGNGWENVEKAIESVNKHKIQGVLGIIDADFKRIEKAIIPENLFLTDFHDKEMMMINSHVWQEILNHFADNSVSAKTGFSKLQEFENNANQPILETLLNLAKPIANIRLLNERQGFGLKFRTQKKKTVDYLKYDKFIAKTTLEIDKIQLQKAVENKSSKLNFFDNSTIQIQLQNVENEQHDLNELCNGHDVINIFSLALEKAIGNHGSSGKVAAERIEENLIVAYRLEDFQKTDLYSALLKWESVNLPYLLFSIQR
jgi:hypothetical protein